MKKIIAAGVLTLALTGQAGAFGDGGLFGEPSYSERHPDAMVYGEWGARFLDRERAKNPIEPGHIPYPCGFNRGNAAAYEVCQRDWMANNPNDYLWQGIK